MTLDKTRINVLDVAVLMRDDVSVTCDNFRPICYPGVIDKMLKFDEHTVSKGCKFGIIY